jgi:hypothetical protein
MYDTCQRESRSLASSQRFEAAWPLRGHHIVQYICSEPSRVQTIDCEVQWLSHGRSAALRLGKYDEAQDMHRQVLKSSEKMLGKKHPSTLPTMNNLASVMGRQGKYSEAEEMHRKVPGMKEVVLGKEHPSTLMSINNLESVAGQARKVRRGRGDARTSVGIGKESPGNGTSGDVDAHE